MSPLWNLGRNMTQIFFFFIKCIKNIFQHECVPCCISDVYSLKMLCFTLRRINQQKDQKMKTVRHDQASVFLLFAGQRLSEDLRCP